MSEIIIPQVITTEEEWHRARAQGIGGSEAAAIIGLPPWCSSQELWKRKTGRVKAPDISDSEAVRYGHAAEALIRGLFALDYVDKYKVTYGGRFDLLRNEEHPFILSTLDGRLTELSTGKKGVLEIKTTSIVRSMQKEKWWKDGKPCIPDQYYCQCLWQMLSGGFDFAVLHAQLKYDYGDDDIRTERRTYRFDREEKAEDIEYLKTEGVKFWTEYIEKDVEPPLILPEI
jgi:putative phage-type endonuclease